MPNQNYITDLLELKDYNIIFKENFYSKQIINNIAYKVFEGYLSYTPDFCAKCGVVFDEHFEKHGFITSYIKTPNISGYKAILKLHKQRYLCKKLLPYLLTLLIMGVLFLNLLNGILLKI